MILVEKDAEHALVILRRSRYVESGEPNRDAYYLTTEEWDDLLFRAASYELEPRKLPDTTVVVALEDVLTIRNLAGAKLHESSGIRCESPRVLCGRTRAGIASFRSRGRPDGPAAESRPSQIG